jgi:hypothetical protein
MFLIKETNSKTSIELGSNLSSDYNHSLSTKDYVKPNIKDYVTPGERFMIGNNKMVVQKGLQMGEDNEKLCSVQQSDYKPLPNAARESAQRCLDTKVYFRDAHFSFECGGSMVNPYISCSKSDFLDPKKDDGPIDAAGRTKGKSDCISRVDNSFEVTVNKTITRYPYEQKFFDTTTASSYKGKSFPRRQPIRPMKAQLESYIHPYTPSFAKDGNGTEFVQNRDLSTVSRRTYVAPEVMKYKV